MSTSSSFLTALVLTAFALAPLFLGLLYGCFIWRRPLFDNLRENAVAFDREPINLAELRKYHAALSTGDPSRPFSLEALRKYNSFGDKVVCTHHLGDVVEDHIDSVKEKAIISGVVPILLASIPVLYFLRTGTSIPAYVTFLAILSPLSVLSIAVQTIILHHELKKQMKRYYSVLKKKH